MADLPSYEEAITRQDWLALVAPYVSFHDYCSLSLVNNRFWQIFAPLLWENPLKTVRLAGLDPSDGKSFLMRSLPAWFKFFPGVEMSPTIPLVLVLKLIASP